MQKPLNILIFGAGAVGSTIGWRLAQNPHVRLSVVCRSNYEAVKQRGFRLTTDIWGNGHFMPYRVSRSPVELTDMMFDYVVCANKATDHSFVKHLASTVSFNTAIVSAQNGVNAEAPLSRAFPNNPIFSAICYISCEQLTPGIIKQSSNIRPHAFHIGICRPSKSDDVEQDNRRLENFVALDRRFKRIDDVQAERWTKQIFNGAWNPAAAIFDLDTHQLLESPYIRIVHQLANEVYEVGVKLGVPLPDNLPTKAIELARKNPSLTPSMLQDRRLNRLMEVESICGTICRLADQIGVPVPTMTKVYSLLLDMNKRILASRSPVGEQDMLGFKYGGLQDLSI